jgi:peroxiredoxin
MKRTEPGAPMPTFRVRGVSGGELDIGRADSWELVVVYRGKHCPLCSRYLSTFNRLLDDFRSLGIRVIALINVILTSLCWLSLRLYING